MVKARSLQDLGLIKQTLSKQAESEAAIAAEKQAAERRAKAEKTCSNVRSVRSNRCPRDRGSN